MEIVLNFDEKELVIKDKSNIEKLYDKLKGLLGKDLKNWVIVSDVVYQDRSWWYYQPYKTYPWDYLRVTRADTSSVPSTGVYCFSDMR